MKKPLENGGAIATSAGGGVRVWEREKEEEKRPKQTQKNLQALKLM